MTDLIAELRARAEASGGDKLLEEAAAALEAAREDANLVYRMIPTLPVTPETCEQATDALTQFCLSFHAAIEAAREDARKWRYWANGPQGTFLTDDLELATAILAAYDKDDDWTVTDIVDPTGAAIDQARGKGGGEVEGG